MQSWNDLISELGRRLQIPELEMDEDRCVHLSFGENLAVMMSEDPRFDRLILSSIVGQALEGDPEFVEELLQANLFWQSTDGATLGLDRESRQILLAARVDAQQAFSPESLEARVQEFVDLTERWIEIVKALRPAAALPAPVAA
jgi:Tir chaperone protein (CesT) family